jgi:hypothetical protein
MAPNPDRERRLIKPGFNAPDEFFVYYELEYLA